MHLVVDFYQAFTVASGNISNGTIDGICIELRTANFDYTAGKTAAVKSNGKKIIHNHFCIHILNNFLLEQKKKCDNRLN